MEKVLSIRQPWASLIVQGPKTIEVRSWSTKHRGRLWIHAGRTLDKDAVRRFSLEPSEMARGAVVGVCELVSCEAFDESTWESEYERHLNAGPFYPPKFAWLLRSASPIEPVEMPGRLGLMQLDAPLLKRA